MNLFLIFLTALLFNAVPFLCSADLPLLEPPQHFGPPLQEHAVTNRALTMAPSMTIAPRGRLWATWYAGVSPGEDHNNYVVLSTSGDGGGTWSEVLTVDPDGGGPVRAFDPELWVSPDGRLFSFWAQARGYRSPELWCAESLEPDFAQPQWSPPRRISEGVMMCKPLVLSSGEWTLPISQWGDYRRWGNVDHSAQLVISTDAGKTWSLRGSCNVPKEVREADEHMFIERKDGSLWLLARTRYGIGESVSTDRGKTWPEVTPSGIQHPTSRFFISRLRSGNFLLVKHGPLDTRFSRSHLTAFLSKDDGRTWLGGLMLDERDGVSYPDGQQAFDGTIRIIYDYDRRRQRNILMATFREEDVAAGMDISNQVKLRQLVSQGTGGKRKAMSGETLNANADGRPLRNTKPGTLSCVDADWEPLLPGARLFNDRSYIAADLPSTLKEASFLRVAMNGQKKLKCEQAGTVFLLTPLPDRNQDSAAPTLLDQGFEKVSLPEVPLFIPDSSANYCTLFQKDCGIGEIIIVGKWAVPILPANTLNP
jgi:hypothetical protein